MTPSHTHARNATNQNSSQPFIFLEVEGAISPSVRFALGRQTLAIYTTASQLTQIFAYTQTMNGLLGLGQHNFIIGCHSAKYPVIFNAT